MKHDMISSVRSDSIFLLQEPVHEKNIILASFRCTASSMNKYDKLRLVGRGAYGTVFLCTRLSDEKEVILKEIPVDQMSIDERQASVNEAKVLSMLDHPNIVGYYESFLEEKTMTIVMEYVQGGTLFDYLKQRDGVLLDEKEVLHFFGQMVYTLQYVHTKLILHRDLKSQNILLNNSKNIVKIGDFGISKVLTSKSKAYTVVGTPCYISPELCEGKPYNQKSDIWALGCILYELMMLKRPFDAHTLPALVMKIMKGSFDPVPDIYSSELKKLLMSMLHIDPNQRPNAAQIMCQPFMINTIFKLYVDIGSIPCTKRSQKSSKLNNDGSDSESRNLNASVAKSEENPNIWLFQSYTTNAILLPPPSKGIITCVCLGGSQKIGLTRSGLLVSWQITTPCVSLQDEFSQEEILKCPTFAPSIVDERFAINITSVVCGKDFTVCQSSNGVIFTFGKASSGCLGHLSNNDITEPRIVEALFSHNITSIACGPKHVMAVSDENKVFTWGYDSHGCLGLGQIDFQALPKEIEIKCEDKKPKKVFCGADCSFIITYDKNLLACGSNRHNKLALDSCEGHQIDELRFFAPVCSEPLPNLMISAVTAGKNHTIILCEKDGLYSVGCNQFFQLGWGQMGLNYSMPGKLEEFNDIGISQISCGDYFSLVVTNDKTLYCWGKCPKSLTAAKGEICSVKIPSHFERTPVLSVACDTENCLILSKGT